VTHHRKVVPSKPRTVYRGPCRTCSKAEFEASGSKNVANRARRSSAVRWLIRVSSKLAPPGGPRRALFLRSLEGRLPDHYDAERLRGIAEFRVKRSER
jgi:hypothetical protein